MISTAHAYSSLISSTDFTGILTDVTAAAGGLISVALVCVGVAFIVRIFIK